MGLPDREEAMKLLREHTQNENLVKHMLAVEGCVRAYARRFGEDENLWGITGLLHDFDYEKHPTPEEHPMFGVRIMEEALEQRHAVGDLVWRRWNEASAAGACASEPHLRTAKFPGRLVVPASVCE